MHIMIYNKIVIFKNYITTCLRTKMKGTVITYCEASKKNTPKRYWEHNNIKNNGKKKKKRQKDYKDDCAQFQWISYENPGLSLASSSPGAMAGKRRGSESRESVVPWRTWPIHWEYLMLSLSRQEGGRDKWRDSPDVPLAEVRGSPSLWEGEGWKPELAPGWRWSHQPIHCGDNTHGESASGAGWGLDEHPGLHCTHGKHLGIIFPKGDIYEQFLSICKLQMGHPSLRRFPRKLQGALSSQMLVEMGGRGRWAFQK